MTKTWRETGIAAAGALALAVSGPFALAPFALAQDWGDAPRVIASNGAVVALPDLDVLTCPQMEYVLERIDLSRYRGSEPLPRGHPDWQIFDYEDRLTRRHYYACMMRAHQLEDPSEAFSFGFSN